MPTLGTPLAPELLQAGSVWQLTRSVNGYARAAGDGLATQAAAGRRFRVLDSPEQAHPGRLRVVLLEDGYPCWMALTEIVGQARSSAPWRPTLLDEKAIVHRLPAVLSWITAAAARPNVYLWGGTVGPNLDCSGLVQTAFASAGIWLPRDAYQQERFCMPVAVRAGDDRLLRPGDLLFFGTPQRCTHVGIHRGGGHYWHSSGQQHGRNGIGSDCIHPRDQHPVACHYRAELRGAGRVHRCHDGTSLP